MVWPNPEFGRQQQEIRKDTALKEKKKKKVGGVTNFKECSELSTSREQKAS